MYYVVFEGGGLEFEPKVHGVYFNLPLAQKCLRVELQKFLENYFPAVGALPGAVIERSQINNYIYFYIYNDDEDLEFNVVANIFVLAEIP